MKSTVLLILMLSAVCVGAQGNKRADVGKDTDTLKPGETFYWRNSRKSNCTVTKTKPPLTKSKYVIPAGGETPARVSKHATPTDYDYDYDCGGGEPKSNPKIKIGSR